MLHVQQAQCHTDYGLLRAGEEGTLVPSSLYLYPAWGLLHLLEGNAGVRHARQRQAAVQHLLVEVAPGPLPGAPRVHCAPRSGRLSETLDTTVALWC